MVIAIILAVLLLITAIALVVTVIFQSNGKSAKLSGSIAGGSTDTFLGKNKQYARDRKLAKMTTIIAIVFVLLVLITSIYTSRALTGQKSGADTTAPTTGTVAASESATGTESVAAEESGEAEESKEAEESTEAEETEGEETEAPAEE